MCPFAYRLLIVALACAFATSGAAWQRCSAATTANAALPAASEQEAHSAHHGASSAHTDHQHTGHHHADHRTPADDNPAGGFDDHACQKFCGLCTLASIAPVASIAGAPLTVSHVLSALAADRINGWAGPLDPGIPKPRA